MAERTLLAERLDGWRRKQRVEWTHVSRSSGVGRNTIYNALDGGTPGTDTLRKIARGLATDPHGGDLDRLAYVEIVSSLFEAAGYDVPPDAAVAALAKLALADVTTEDVQAWANSRLATLSRTTVSAQLAILSSALKSAVPRHLANNPATGVRLPKRTQTPPKAWRADEVARLVAVANGSAHELWLWLSLGTGLRCGEARALAWTDVDLVNLTVRVERAVNRLTGKVGPTKSGRVRVIDLPRELVPMLVAHRARQRPKEQHVCTSAVSGRVPSYSSLRSYITRLCASAGVTPLGMHSLRHTYATLALEAGVPLKEVSESLGHASVAITAEVYSHSLNERRRRAANAIGAILAPKQANSTQIGTRESV